MVGPFIGSESVASGSVTPHALRTRFTALHHDVYLPDGVEPTAVMRARGAWLWSGRKAVVAGASAAALHGAKWLDPRAPAELLYDNRRPPTGITCWSDAVADDEVVLVDGMRVTTPARTAVDYACRYRLDEAVAAIDALSNATRLKVAEIESIADRYNGRRGVRRARCAIPLVDGGAQSPRETWLRLLIIRAGYPRPDTQVPVRNEYGMAIAHLDLGWEDRRLALEYEGAHHRLSREQFAYDIRKHEQIRELGWNVLRVTSMDPPAVILDRLASRWQDR
jgi:hypothetical protein